MTRWLLIAVVLFLDSAHLPAPIALAWGHPGLRRQVALQSKVKFVGVALVVLGLSVLSAPLTLTFWPDFHPTIGTKVRAIRDWNAVNPFTALLTLFVVWNLYHFGSQNFGLWRLWRRGRGNRLLQKSSWLTGTVASMVGTPFVAPVLAPVSMWAFGLWHWLPAIWLAAKVSRHPAVFWLSSGLAGIAISGGLWAAVAYGSLAVQMTAVSARLGAGFVHFLYDRWVWRLSDPRVRAVMLPSLFAV